MTIRDKFSSKPETPKKILWIEDGALVEVDTQAGPIISNPKYKLTYALNATDAIGKILQNEYDVIIIDIRIPPGNDRTWQKSYERTTRLGLSILCVLLNPGNPRIPVKPSQINLPKFDNANPPWFMNTNIYGVFTVENKREVTKDLIKNGININEDCIIQKKTGMASIELSELVTRILTNQG